MDSQRLCNTRNAAASSSGPKSRSLSGTCQSNTLELLALFRVKVLGSGIIIRSTDVEPETIARVGEDPLLVSNEVKDEVREIQVHSRLNIVDDRRFADVDSHADVV